MVEIGDGSKMVLSQRCLILRLHKINLMEQKLLHKIACGSILNLNMNSLIQSVVTLRDTFVKNNDFCHVLLFIYAGDITHVLYFDIILQ